MNKKNYKIIDVNLNRINESLRVLEDVARFVYNNKKIVEKLKKIRHKIKSEIKKNNFYHFLIEARNVKEDKCKFINPDEEFKRNSIEDVVIANIKRIEESCRVLEEMFKLISYEYSSFFKEIRFKFYSIEKEFYKVIKT